MYKSSEYIANLTTNIPSCINERYASNLYTNLIEYIEFENYNESVMSQKILCVEDNTDNALILESILRRYGFTPFIARDGNTAIQLASNQRPDLIICDFHLPGENAPLVIQKIRQTPYLKHIPIIILTADMYNGPESHAIGIAAYLNKPIIPQELLRTINEILA